MERLAGVVINHTGLQAAGHTDLGGLGAIRAAGAGRASDGHEGLSAAPPAAGSHLDGKPGDVL